MRILSLASINDRTDIALSEDATCRYSVQVTLGNRFSEEIWKTLADVLNTAGWALADIDCFACVRGPGSFTGLRVALAAMNGLAFALDKPIVGFTVDELSHGQGSLALRCGERAYEVATTQKLLAYTGPVLPEYGAAFKLGPRK